MQLLMDETLEAQEDNDQDSDGETPSAKPSTPGSAGSKLGGASRKRSTLNFNFMRGKGSTKRATSDVSRDALAASAWSFTSSAALSSDQILAKSAFQFLIPEY